MKFTLVALMLCWLFAFPLLAQQGMEPAPAEVPGLATATPDVAPTTNVFMLPLAHVAVQSVVDRLNDSVAYGGLKELLPEGVGPIVGIRSLNQLLVRMDKTEDVKEATEDLARIVKMMDQPLPPVTIEVLQVKMPTELGDALVSKMRKVVPPDQKTNLACREMSSVDFQRAISVPLLKGTAKVVIAPRFLIKTYDDFPMVIDIRSYYGRYAGLLVKQLRVDGKTISCDLQSILPNDPKTPPSTLAVINDGYTRLFEQTSIKDAPKMAVYTFVTLSNAEKLVTTENK